MPRTREQRRATQGLFALGEDALRNALTFLSISDCARGPGETSRALRELSMSKLLQNARASDSYVLSGEKHGVVHALATSFGTRRWRTRPLPQSALYETFEAATPPPEMSIAIHRRDPAVQDMASAHSDVYFKCAFVDHSSHCVETGTECTTGDVTIQLPLRIQIRGFRIGYGRCCRSGFTEWTFEARESEQSTWRVLYEHDGDMQWRRSEANCADAFFPVEAFTCTSCRIRVGSHAQGHGCMHLRGFELFGAVLPPWRFFDVVGEEARRREEEEAARLAAEAEEARRSAEAEAEESEESEEEEDEEPEPEQA